MSSFTKIHQAEDGMDQEDGLFYLPSTSMYNGQYWRVIEESQDYYI
jgi:hypothetical protein